MPRLAGLYVLIDPAACRGRSPVAVAEAALRGGAALIQWRDKKRDKGLQLPEARAIYSLCRSHGASFIVNDHADLALIIGGDGVHVGQSDLPVAEVRRILPPEFIVGASTNTVEEARAAQAAGASYIAVGDLFGTASKGRTRPASLARLAAVKAAVDAPVCAIGGINADNVAGVVAAGTDIVAVISAVCGADDPEAAAAALAQAMRKAKAGR